MSTYPLVERRIVPRPYRRRQWPPPERTASNLLEIFESTVDAHPRSFALVCGATRITYRDLDALGNRVARALIDRRIGPGAKVALMVPRSIDSYAALVGVLKCGATYMPVDHLHPPERLALALEGSGVRAIVTNAEISLRLPRFDGVVLRMDADRRVINAEPPVRLARSNLRAHESPSPFFGMSIEELWIAYPGGATLELAEWGV